MSEDGELTEKESGKDRDINGRFLPGNKLGGRGLKKELSEAIEVIKGLLLDDDADLTSSKALDPLGRVLLHGITLKDPKVKNDSAKLFFNWLSKMREAEEREKDDSSVSPEEVERFREIVRMRAELDVIKSKEISDLLCFECKRNLGIDDEDFERK